MIVEVGYRKLKIKPTGPIYPVDHDYKDALCCRIDLRGEHIRVEESNREHRFSNAKDFMDFALQYNKILTFSPQHQIEYFLRYLNPIDLINLKYDGEVSIPPYHLIRYTPHKITLRRGNAWCSIYNIANIARESLDTPLLVKQFKDQIVNLSELLGPFNISTPGTSSRKLLSNLCPGLYGESHRSVALLESRSGFIKSTIHGTWMSPHILGSSQGVENLDFHKAHLRCIKKVPSIARNGCMAITKKDYIPEALMGFYLAEFNLPNIKNTVVTTTRWNGKARPFSGPRIQYVAKPILDHLATLGIPFKIHDSLQYVATKEAKYPYVAFSNIWEKVINTWSEDYYLIDLKMLSYKTLIGSMQNIYPPRGADPFDKDKTMETHKLYNPLLASTVYALVNVEVYNQLLECNNPLYRRHDGISRETGDGEVLDNFRVESKGNLFVYNSILHDNPGRELWRELARRTPNQSSISFITQGSRYGLDQAMIDPMQIGKDSDYMRTAFPIADNMILRKPIKNNKQLLQDQVETHLPTSDQIETIESNQLPHLQDLDNKWLKVRS